MWSQRPPCHHPQPTGEVARHCSGQSAPSISPCRNRPCCQLSHQAAVPTEDGAWEVVAELARALPARQLWAPDRTAAILLDIPQQQIPLQLASGTSAGGLRSHHSLPTLCLTFPNKSRLASARRLRLEGARVAVTSCSTSTTSTLTSRLAKLALQGKSSSVRTGSEHQSWRTLTCLTESARLSFVRKGIARMHTSSAMPTSPSLQKAWGPLLFLSHVTPTAASISFHKVSHCGPAGRPEHRRPRLLVRPPSRLCRSLTHSHGTHTNALLFLGALSCFSDNNSFPCSSFTVADLCPWPWSTGSLTRTTTHT